MPTAITHRDWEETNALKRVWLMIPKRVGDSTWAVRDLWSYFVVVAACVLLAERGNAVAHLRWNIKSQMNTGNTMHTKYVLRWNNTYFTARGKERYYRNRKSSLKVRHMRDNSSLHFSFVCRMLMAFCDSARWDVVHAVCSWHCSHCHP